MVLFFSVRGEAKCEINYKKQKIYFCPFWELSLPFLVVCLPEKMIRKCFGGNEKEWRKKKSNLKKKVLSAFFRHYGSERRSVCG